MCGGSGGLLFCCSVSPRIRRNRTNRFRSWGVNCCSRWGSFCSRFILLFCFLWFQKKQKKQRTGYLFCSWWCVVACEFYSAVLILTVPEQSEQSSFGLVCVLPLRERSSGWWFLLREFYSSVLIPPIQNNQKKPVHTLALRSAYRYIRSGVASLLERFVLLLCFLWFQSNQKKRTNPNGGWCGGAGTVYSAVPFCGVQNNQNKRVAGLFHFALCFLHTAQMVFLSRVFRFWSGCRVVGVLECIPRTFSRCTQKIAG